MKAFVKDFIQTFKRHTALNPEAPEHSNLLISVFFGNLPDIRKQIKDNVVGWLGQPLDIILVATQFFEE